MFDGGSAYPDDIDICNCGFDPGEGAAPPRAELVERPGLEAGSLSWRMQLSGASLYWHVATTSGKQLCGDPEFLHGKDVLEVACMRGGGARYLASAMGTRSYIATDIDEDCIESCRSSCGSAPLGGLDFRVAGAVELRDVFGPEAFDAVLCVQSVAVFADPGAFVANSAAVLRPGGRLLLCDMFSMDDLRATLQMLQESGLVCDAVHDLSEGVTRVGVCVPSEDRGYALIVARKPAPEDAPPSGGIADGA